MKSETQIRYEGIKEVASEKISKIVWGMEVNAQNVFDEVSKTKLQTFSYTTNNKAKKRRNRKGFASFNC